MLVSQHVLSHFFDDLLAAFYIVLGPLNLVLELLDLIALIKRESVKLVLLGEERVTSLTHLTQFIVSARYLPLKISLRLQAPFLFQAKLLLVTLLLITSCGLELLKFTLRIFKLA